MKWFGILLTGFVYFIADQGIVKTSWLPDEVRGLLIKTKYREGECLVHLKGSWRAHKKRVLGLKFVGEREFYLLKDEDRHQFITTHERIRVEHETHRIQC